MDGTGIFSNILQIFLDKCPILNKIPHEPKRDVSGDFSDAQGDNLLTLAVNTHTLFPFSKSVYKYMYFPPPGLNFVNYFQFLSQFRWLNNNFHTDAAAELFVAVFCCNVILSLYYIDYTIILYILFRFQIIFCIILDVCKW